MTSFVLSDIENIEPGLYICGAFNKFPDFFVQAFKIVVYS